MMFLKIAKKRFGKEEPADLEYIFHIQLIP